MMIIDCFVAGLYIITHIFDTDFRKLGKVSVSTLCEAYEKEKSAAYFNKNFRV